MPIDPSQTESLPERPSLAQIYLRRHGTLVAAAAALTEDLMRGDPSQCKAGYTRENALLAALDLFETVGIPLSQLQLILLCQHANQVHLVLVDNGDSEPELWAFAEEEQARQFAEKRSNTATVRTVGVLVGDDAREAIEKESD